MVVCNAVIENRNGCSCSHYKNGKYVALILRWIEGNKDTALGPMSGDNGARKLVDLNISGKS